jgi:hypothetical protein
VSQSHAGLVNTLSLREIIRVVTELSVYFCAGFCEVKSSVACLVCLLSSYVLGEICRLETESPKCRDERHSTVIFTVFPISLLCPFFHLQNHLSVRPSKKVTRKRFTYNKPSLCNTRSLLLQYHSLITCFGPIWPSSGASLLKLITLHKL